MSAERPAPRNPTAFPKVLSAIASTLDSVESIAPRLARVLELTRAILPYDQAALLQLQDGAPDVLVAHPPVSPREQDALAARLKRIADLLVATSDVAEDVAEGEPPPAPARSHLAMPLVGLDEVMGVLLIECDAPEAYGEECIAALSVVAAELGAYLTTVRLVEKQAEVTRELTRALEFQQLLVGIVSHDLRNPLTVITMSATTNLRRSHDERMRRALDRIVTSASRANLIIRDLLDATQARLGQGIPIERAMMDLDALLRVTVDDMLVAHPERRLTYESAGPVEGAGDRERLAQVFGNLLTNALRYSPEDSEVRVRLRVANDAAEIEVQNQGPVIPAELLPVLFDPFRRGPAQKKAGAAGLGLGLYIVHEIVTRHEGRIEARSTAAEGTTFTVIVPCFAQKERSTLERVEPDRFTDFERRILVVDDDDDIREALANVLRQQGYYVQCARDGLEALERMRESRQPDVVLLDLMMPVMDGFAAIADMKKDPALADIPVIVISSGRHGERVLGVEYLAKPVKLNLLLASIGRHCGRP